MLEKFILQQIEKGRQLELLKHPQRGNKSALEMLRLEQAEKDRGLGKQTLRHVKDLEMMKASNLVKRHKKRPWFKICFEEAMNKLNSYLAWFEKYALAN